jgi:L-aminopeptidase/D-esterase-like protein
MSIWTFNTLAALDALIDRTRHKDLIARLEKASREADQLKEDIAFAVATARAEQRQLSKEVGSKVVLPQMTEILRDTVKEARANAAVIEKAEPVKKAKSA